ncbi:MAG: radical SAM protein [Thermodesulfobacteriota bacterium]|nr:radical SAM protein [Thermodesulfobacteriota bacterium]
MTCLGDQLGMEFSPEEIAEARRRNGLLSMELELSRTCNLRCVYCYASSGKPLDHELTLAEIEDVVEQAVQLGARKIIVLGGGEPLLYPQLFEVLDFIINQNLVVDLFTNGTLMSPDFARKLYMRGVGVVIKMNSRKAAIQDYLADREGTLAAINKGLTALREAGYPDEEHSLGIETIICRQNYDELPDLWRWARRQEIVPYVEVMTLQGRATDHPELEVSPDEIKTLFETLARIDAEELGCHWTPHPPLVASQCARHEYSCTITSNGEVHPCPGVNVSAGNIREQKLSDILTNSKVIQDLRNIRTNIKGHCADCDISDQCYGCRGHAYQVTGDYLAADPLCWLPVKKD